MKLVSLTVCLLFVVGLSAQFSTPFSIGSVGGGTMSMSSFSGPISIKSTGCVIVSNGISTFGEDSLKKVFSNKCPERILPEVIVNRSPTFRLFPNPVLDMVTLKALENMAINEPFFIYLFNPAGVCVKKMNTTYKELLTGLKIKVADLAQGVYYLSVQSAKVSTQIKLIKLSY